jgi:hypothetical protein
MGQIIERRATGQSFDIPDTIIPGGVNFIEKAFVHLDNQSNWKKQESPFVNHVVGAVATIILSGSRNSQEAQQEELQLRVGELLTKYSANVPRELLLETLQSCGMTVAKQGVIFNQE